MPSASTAPISRKRSRPSAAARTTPRSISEDDPMKYGIAMFPTDYAIQADALARELEARGFESLWLPEHTHIPAIRKSPWPGGADLPRDYWHTLDPFVALGAAAAVTRTLMLGTGICLVIERWKILRERIAAMKAIWTQEEAQYHGKYVNFDKLWSYPKPIQKPYPPILMGGSGPHARQRAAEFDGHWMPIIGRDPLDEAMADLRQRAEKAGRDPATVTVSLFGVRPDEGKLAGWRDMGVTRVVFFVPSALAATVLPLLDQYAAVAKKVG